MRKRYLVTLSPSDKSQLREVIKRLSGSSQKVRRAQILLKADSTGPSWTDAQIAEAFDCRTKTVENIRKRFVEQGFESTLAGAKRAMPPTAKCLVGASELITNTNERALLASSCLLNRWDTVTNFTTMVDVFEQLGIEHVYLVTSDFHMPQARTIAFLVFESRGITCTPVGVDSRKHEESG